MTQQPASVLIVEDQVTLARTYVAYLAGEQVRAAAAASAAEALAHMERERPGAVVLDVNLPDMNGLDLLREMRRRGISAQVVIITSDGSVNLAVAAMREGAFDFIVKPFAADRLRVAVRNALDRRPLGPAPEMAADAFCGFIGGSPAMQSVYRLVRDAAPSKATVFITGESGTGKELCAEAIHRLSRRGMGPFVPVNCAAIPKDLLESELFGHVKGAFTGATADRLGAAMRANGGTLFLDEIGEMRPDFQAKMLRFLQNGVVQRIGDDKPQSVDVRIVCATNRDPKEEVAAGRFREDLFYRLYVIPIELPPLRARGNDVAVLARHLLDQYGRDDEAIFSGFTGEAEAALVSYAWPGNIRELQNVIRKIVVLGRGPVVDLSMLPPEIARAKPAGRDPIGFGVEPAGSQACSAQEPFAGPIRPLQETIDRAIEAAIAACGGSIPRAAQSLKVSPSTIYRRLQARDASA
jgi:two-component system repressor protein LuxO